MSLVNKNLGSDVEMELCDVDSQLTTVDNKPSANPVPFLLDASMTDVDDMHVICPTDHTVATSLPAAPSDKQIDVSMDVDTSLVKSSPVATDHHPVVQASPDSSSAMMMGATDQSHLVTTTGNDGDPPQTPNNATMAITNTPQLITTTTNASVVQSTNQTTVTSSAAPLTCPRSCFNQSKTLIFSLPPLIRRTGIDTGSSSSSCSSADASNNHPALKIQATTSLSHTHTPFAAAAPGTVSADRNTRHNAFGGGCNLMLNYARCFQPATPLRRHPLAAGPGTNHGVKPIWINDVELRPVGQQTSSQLATYKAMIRGDRSLDECNKFSQSSKTWIKDFLDEYSAGLDAVSNCQFSNDCDKDESTDIAIAKKAAIQSRVLSCKHRIAKVVALRSEIGGEMTILKEASLHELIRSCSQATIQEFRAVERQVVSKAKALQQTLSDFESSRQAEMRDLKLAQEKRDLELLKQFEVRCDEAVKELSSIHEESNRLKAKLADLKSKAAQQQLSLPTNLDRPAAPASNLLIGACPLYVARSQAKRLTRGCSSEPVSSSPTSDRDIVNIFSSIKLTCLSARRSLFQIRCLLGLVSIKLTCSPLPSTVLDGRRRIDPSSVSVVGIQQVCRPPLASTPVECPAVENFANAVLDYFTSTRGLSKLQSSLGGASLAVVGMIVEFLMAPYLTIAGDFRAIFLSGHSIRFGLDESTAPLPSANSTSQPSSSDPVLDQLLKLINTDYSIKHNRSPLRDDLELMANLILQSKVEEVYRIGVIGGARIDSNSTATDGYH